MSPILAPEWIPDVISWILECLLSLGLLIFAIKRPAQTAKYAILLFIRALFTGGRSGGGGRSSGGWSGGGGGFSGGGASGSW